MDIFEFKNNSLISKNVDITNNDAERITTEYFFNDGKNTYKIINLKTINKYGKQCCNKNKYSINNKGCCKRVFKEEIFKISKQNN